MKKSRKILKKLPLTLALILLFNIIGFYIWTLNVYTAEKTDFFDPSHSGYTTNNKDVIIYGNETTNHTGIIIYPGGKVDPIAYGYIAEQLSLEGYLVIIQKMPLNLGVFGINKANHIIQQYPTIESWYIGGHSLGGVSAAEYTKKHTDIIDGIFFLGAYPAADLSNSDIKALNIYASMDGLTLVEDIEEHKPNHPKNTIYYEIIGGNHAGFGIYGQQKGDSFIRKISHKEQQDQVIDQIKKWINL